jgi:ATP-dependent 26S proteasome regulatory subunit
MEDAARRLHVLEIHTRSLEMTHDHVRATLAAEALDAFDGDEREAVLREAAAALALVVPYRPMVRERSDRVRARLLAAPRRTAPLRRRPALPE